MAEFLAKRITRAFIRKFHIEEESWDLYYLGIEVITTTVLTSLLIIACGILLNNCVGSMAFLLCFMTLRGYAGGYHARTRLRCLFATIFCYVCSAGMMKGLLSVDGIWQALMILSGLVLAVVLFVKYAPVVHPRKKIHEEIREQNKIMTFLLLFVWYLVCLLLAAFGIYEISAQIWATTVIVALLLCIRGRRK